jgi:hypothetical protein
MKKIDYMIENYPSPPTFLGRNGDYDMAGIEITVFQKTDMIRLRPITKKNKTGRSWLEIPKDKVEDVIYALAEEAGLGIDLWGVK